MPAHHEYRKLWVVDDYPADMASAIAARPPRDKRNRRVYHLTSADHAISDIENGRLKLARLADLNDPFELLAINFREKPTRKATSDFKEAYGAKVGLLCFSEDWMEPLLWSHYANKHRGICLGFDVPRGLLERVSYEDERLLDHLDRNADPVALPADLQEQLSYTKYSGWNYEREHRRFIPLADATPAGSLHFISFNSVLSLAEVILGVDCDRSVHDVRKTVTACYPHVITYRARLMHKKFRIVPDEKDVP